MKQQNGIVVYTTFGNLSMRFLQCCQNILQKISLLLAPEITVVNEGQSYVENFVSKVPSLKKMKISCADWWKRCSFIWWKISFKIFWKVNCLCWKPKSKIFNAVVKQLRIWQSCRVISAWCVLVQGIRLQNISMCLVYLENLLKNSESAYIKRIWGNVQRWQHWNNCQRISILFLMQIF